MALKRLSCLEGKLKRNSRLKDKYHEFMREYIHLGHMVPALSPGKYIIPHHCVVKDDGTDIKVRVFFDAAARTSNGSLNDHLLVGPKLQSDISVILLNFRLHKYVFTADAVKMFRQILVSPEDRMYQHILWRFELAMQVHEYQLLTVSYGQSCTPYLANGVILQLVRDEGQYFPLGAKALTEDMYVDDIASGTDTLEHILKVFSYKIITPSIRPTKRGVLSPTAKVYDPLGYLGPTVVLAKIMLQEAWKRKLAWDDPFPLDLQGLWTNFVEELELSGRIRIARHTLPSDSIK